MEKVQEQISVLIKVQKLDAEIYRLNKEKAAKPAEKQALQQAFSRLGEALKAKEGQSRSLQLKRKDCEMNLQDKEKDIKKYQVQLLQVKTNKEYMSLQKEIEGLRADSSVLEDDILELMEKADKVKVEIGQERQGLVAKEKEMSQETAKIDREIKQIEEKTSSLEKERGALAANVEQGLLSQYERILKAKDGLALVPVVGESCGGCHRVFPPQVINEVQIQDKIVTCDFCARLLYWPDSQT